MTGAEIKAARGPRGLREFARLVGISPTLLSFLERGQRQATAAVQAKIAAAPPVSAAAAPDQDLLSLAQCCALLGLKYGSDKTLRVAVRKGALPYVERLDPRNRPQYFIRRGDLLHWHATQYQRHRDPRRQGRWAVNDVNSW
jgi:transcriptional regulator with XRE-family HTH domain